MVSSSLLSVLFFTLTFKIKSSRVERQSKDI